MAVNYKIEGGFDFYAALAPSDEDDVNSIDGDALSDDKLCQITAEPLDDFAVFLPCGHSFNYLPLHREIKSQKSSGYQSLSDSRLRHNQFKCPYCRRVYDKLLPYIPIEGIAPTQGVSTTKPLQCLNVFPCKHLITRGKNAGCACGRPSLCPKKAFLCSQHAIKKETGRRCKAILKTGKNKGQACGARCISTYCKRHTPKN